jgi:DNA-binding CsgD family transcriptional regulator
VEVALNRKISHCVSWAIQAAPENAYDPAEPTACAGARMPVDAIKAATDDLLTAALLGEGWEPALCRLAAAAQARDVVVIRNRNRRLVAAICTPEIVEPLAAVLAGRAPPSSRQVRVNHDFHPGFRVDHDDYTDEQMARDPFYQDLLRPHGLFWHANARLDWEAGDELAISFKRRLKAGPYQRSHAVALDTMLPDVKAAARIAHRVLDAEAAGMARLLHQRGDPVFELDAWGRVLRTHGFAHDLTQGVSVLGRRLAATDPTVQAVLDLAVAAAVRAPQRPTGVSLPGHDGARFYLQIVPVGGQARDVFLAAAAVAMLIRRSPRPAPVSIRHALVRDAFNLTDREVDVAVLLAEGLPLTDIARHLRIQVGTARNHLKSVFEKTDTSRQAELVALMARLTF